MLLVNNSKGGMARLRGVLAFHTTAHAEPFPRNRRITNGVMPFGGFATGLVQKEVCCRSQVGTARRSRPPPQSGLRIDSNRTNGRIGDASYRESVTLF
jgi:hypothetical protein